MGFESAITLNEKFGSEAAFYKLEVSERVHTCSNVRKIYRRGCMNVEADALIVLSNPGSCRPADKQALYELNPPNMIEVRMQKAKANHTEYQLMRLMDRMVWDLVYIIHLTDLQSKDPIDLEHDLYFMNYNRHRGHSIFTLNRNVEIHQLIGSQTKIIAGWGTQKYLQTQATKALRMLKDIGAIYGLPHKTVPFYYHPYPFTKSNRVRWLGKVEGQLRSAANV